MEILKTKIKSSRLKLFFYFTILLLFSFSTTSYTQEKFKFGVKGGIGFWRIISLQKSLNISQPIIYSYPMGFTLGFYSEKKLSEHLFIAGELLFQNSLEMVTIYTGYEGILEQKITSKYLTIPIIIKLKTPLLWDVYFFLGPSFSYLINASYHFYDQIYHDGGNGNITKDLPSISFAVESGFGKEIEILKSNFTLELRAQLGLTRFQYYDISYNPPIGNWRNAGLMFLVGYEF